MFYPRALMQFIFSKFGQKPKVRPCQLTVGWSAIQKFHFNNLANITDFLRKISQGVVINLAEKIHIKFICRIINLP